MAAIVVAFEGPPGAGKSTVVERNLEYLINQGLAVEIVDLDTHPKAEHLRLAVAGLDHQSPMRLQLFWALRELQGEVVLERRTRVQVLLVDRYVGSTWAYDHYGNGIPREVLSWHLQRIEKPDLTLFLDAPLDVLLERKRSTTLQDTEFAERLLTGFRNLACFERWHRVDATQSVEVVSSQCLRAIEAHMSGRDPWEAMRRSA